MKHLTAVAFTAEQRADYLNRLDEGTLTALMRSTRAIGDRAVRRQLSGILVGLVAARELRAGSVGYPELVVEAAECGVLATVGEFIADVLGPRLLLADSAYNSCEPLLPLASAASDLFFSRQRALDAIAVEVTGRVIERNETLSAILPESEWDAKAFSHSATELAQVAYSAGYTLSSTDYFASAGLAAQAFGSVSSPGVRVDLRRATLAAVEESGSWDPGLVRTRAIKDGGVWRITGKKWYVTGALTADSIFVIAQSACGPSMYLVKGSAPGVSIELLDTLDSDRPLARVVLDDVPGVMVGSEGAGGQIMSRTVDRATTVLAAEQIGIIDLGLKVLSELPPSCNDSESWRRYTREIAAMEVLRWSAIALWRRAIKLQGRDDLSTGATVCAMAHIGCSSAARKVALRLPTASAGEFDPGLANEISRRVRTTSLLFGGEAVAHERLLERLGL
ncbi:acyl-CoA dehydrogenase family protein [Prescottella equi]